MIIVALRQLHWQIQNQQAAMQDSTDAIERKASIYSLFGMDIVNGYNIIIIIYKR